MSSSSPLEDLRQAIERLEARVKRLEEENAAKDEQLETLRSSAKTMPPSTQAEKRKPGSESAPVEEEPAGKKKPELFPAIGELVESSSASAQDAGGVQTSNHVDDKSAGEEGEQEEDYSNTGVHTTELGVTEIESLCLQCEENGVTKLLLTKIPFFREVILMSFDCPHCGFRDVQIQPGAPVQEKGNKYTFVLHDTKDLSRQIVKSDSATLRIEELDFEIPPNRGAITNVEGLVTDAIESLTETQDRRRLVDGPEACEQVDLFIAKLRTLLNGDMFPFTVTMDDPSGNSFIDNPFIPKADPNLKMFRYVRSREQQIALGLKPDDAEVDYKTGSRLDKTRMDLTLNENFTSQEVLQIPSPCPECQVDGFAETCIVNLPFFKEVIIMAYNCDECGFRDTEIKGGGAIPKQGRKETLHVLEPKVDLARDVIKSDTAGVIIPELEVELTRGSLGGMYTTVEGLMQKMMDNLFENRVFRDSADPATRKMFDDLEAKFKDCIAGRVPFTLIVQDPLANSYVYSPYDPPETDPRLKFELYERSWEEDEELGLHDMNVDQVEMPDAEDISTAEQVFSHLQVGQKDTHPTPFAHGGE